MKIWCNGAWIDSAAPAIAAGDRGFLLGDGLFETVLCEGGAPLRFARHARRLHASAAALGLPAPLPAAVLTLVVREVLAANGLDGRAAARITWSAGAGPRGLLRPHALDPVLLVSAAPSEAIDTPASVMMSAVTRNPRAPAAQHKTLSYIDNVVARREAAAAGADEALVLNTDGALAGGSMSNIFVVIDGAIQTPRLEDGALPGVLRAALIENNLSIKEARIDAEALTRVESAFMTNALLEIRPIAQLNGRALAHDERITHLRAALQTERNCVSAP